MIVIIIERGNCIVYGAERRTTWKREEIELSTKPVVSKFSAKKELIVGWVRTKRSPVGHDSSIKSLEIRRLRILFESDVKRECVNMKGLLRKGQALCSGDKIAL